jgi:hypothetical protein
MKICLKTDVVEAGQRFPRGLIGRAVLAVGCDAWLVEFKYPDFAYPCRAKRVYAEVRSEDFQAFDEASYQGR